MKIEVRIHTFLVQISKMGHYWENLIRNGDTDDLTDIIYDVKDANIIDIIRTIPGVEKLNFHEFLQNVDDSSLDSFCDHYASGNDPDIVRRFLTQMLAVIPDGKICIEMTDLEFEKFSALLESTYCLRDDDPDFPPECDFPEYADPLYNEFIMVA